MAHPCPVSWGHNGWLVISATSKDPILKSRMCAMQPTDGTRTHASQRRREPVVVVTYAYGWYDTHTGTVASFARPRTRACSRPPSP
eukprot:2493817-Prymnesium_polylepis.1